MLVLIGRRRPKRQCLWLVVTWRARWCHWASPRRWTSLGCGAPPCHCRRWASYCLAVSWDYNVGNWIVYQEYLYYSVLTYWPVWKAKGEKLETGWSEEQLPVLLAEIIVAGDLVAELEDDVNGGGEEAVELWDPGGLHCDQPLLGLELLLLQLHVLQHTVCQVAARCLQIRCDNFPQCLGVSRLMVNCDQLLDLDSRQLNNILSPIWEC